ncbi:MAG: hypothetical protein IJC19_04260 [Clostridia bacterium]|nr:hypothetical protein [Clostridia bacterium]
MEFIFYGFVFWLGGTLYQTLELWWRKRTHGSMFLAGGCAAVLLEFLCNGLFFAFPLILRCLFGAIIITGVEFTFGCVVNLGMGLKVWDYSGYPCQILGQVCLFYSILWGIVSLPALLILDWLHRLIV